MRRLARLAPLLLVGCATVSMDTSQRRSPTDQAIVGIVEDERDHPGPALRAWVTVLERSFDPALLALALDHVDALVADGVLGAAPAEVLRGVDERKMTVEVRRLLWLARARVARMGNDMDALRSAEQHAGCGLPWRAGTPVGPLARAHTERMPLGASFAESSGAVTRARGCRVLAVTPDARPGAIPIALEVEMAEAGTLDLWVGSEQPSRVWIDGAGERAPDPHEPIMRTRRLRIVVPAGSHRLVVVIAAPYGRVEVELGVLGKARFAGPTAAVRTDVDGRSVTRVPVTRRAAGTLIGSYVTVTEATRVGDAAGARIAVERLLEVAPRSAPALALAARVAAEDPTVPVRIARDRARRLYERALALDDAASRVRFELGRLALDRDRARDALALVVAAPDPRSLRTAILTSEVLRARARDGEVSRALGQVAPDAQNACLLTDAWLADDRIRHRPVERSRAERAAACRPDSVALADFLRRKGELAEAEAELRRVVAADPIGENPRMLLAEVLLERGRPADAVPVLEALVAMARRSVSYRLRLIDVLVAAGRGSEAQRALRAGLELEPDSAELAATARSLARSAGMDASLDDADADRIDGRAVMDAFARAQRRYEGPAVFVLDRAVTRVYENGARRTVTHQIVKVLGKEGIDRWGEWQLPVGAELLTLRAWKPDGSRLEPEEVAEKESVSLPGLGVGDYVEVELIERAPPPAAFVGGFLAERFYFASFDAPLDRSEYVVIAPEGMTVSIDRRGASPEMITTKRSEAGGAVTVRSFVASQVGQRETEPSAVPAVELMPSVRAYANVTRGAWRDYLVDYAWSSRRRDPELTTLAERLVVDAKSDKGKAIAIDRWVRANIKRGDSLEDAATVILARREGSRPTLLAALAEAVGLSTRMLLARSTRAAAIDTDLEAFDHPIVEVAGMLFDPRYRYARGGELSPALRGADALVLAREVPATPVTLPAASPDRRLMKVKMTLSPAGGGRVEVEEQLVGWPAVEWRESLAQLAPDRVRPQFEQGTLAYFFPGAVLDTLSWEAAESDDVPFVVRYTLTSPSLVRRLGDAFVVPMPFSAQLLRRYATGAARRSPLLIDDVPLTDLELELVVPSGAKVEPAPDVEAITDTGTFSQHESLEREVLHVSSRFALPTRRVPAAEVPQLLDWAGRVDRAEAAAARVRMK